MPLVLIVMPLFNKEFKHPRVTSSFQFLVAMPLVLIGMPLFNKEFKHPRVTSSF